MNRSARWGTAAAVLMLPLAALAGCGEQSSSEPDPGTSDEPTNSASGPGPDDEPGANADGACGDGAFKTKVIKAAQGVRMTIPAEWKVRGRPGGSYLEFTPPDPDQGGGLINVEPATSQDFDEVVDEVLRFTLESAEQTSEQDLDLEGFEAGRMVTSKYDDSDNTFAVDVVALTGDGAVVEANLTREPAQDQALGESCLSTLSRSGAE